VDYTNSVHSLYLPILVLDADTAAAATLASQLRVHGLHTDIATSCWAAQIEARAKHYRVIVAAADLGLSADLDCLEELRQRSLGTWIIVISPKQPPREAEKLARRHGADALLVAPFSLQDLIRRLLIFSVRPRPA
jgi:DNA-binding response OmpR family regulator